MSDKEDDFRPSAMSLQALITPIVAVLLILAGVVLSVLLTGTSIQNDAEAVASQQLIDSAFKTVGRDLGRVAVTLARTGEAHENLVEDFDRAWADERLSSVQSGFGAVGAMVVGSDDSVIYRSRTRATRRQPDHTGHRGRRQKPAGAESGWTSAFVTMTAGFMSPRPAL